MNFLEIKGLKKSFGQGESHIDVLKGIDMTINKGEFCVLLGPSGSGKSTLLNIIVVLIVWMRENLLLINII